MKLTKSQKHIILTTYNFSAFQFVPHKQLLNIFNKFNIDYDIAYNYFLNHICLSKDKNFIPK